MLQGSNEKDLAIKRSQFIRHLRITVKTSEKTKNQEQLISIETFNTLTNKSIELVMRTLTDLDYLATYMTTKYGGHIIPVLKTDLYFQKNPKMNELLPQIQAYLKDLKKNKYCRQDSKFYCFLIEQHMVFPKQVTYDKVLSKTTDLSRKYLSSIFTRQLIPKKQTNNELIVIYNNLKEVIESYNQIKYIGLIKAKEAVYFEEVMNLFTELSSVPCFAVQPQEESIDAEWKMIQATDKLIFQSSQAFARWKILIENVRELQNNVYKGLHEDAYRLQIKENQLKQCTKYLSQQFLELSEYICDRTEKISQIVFQVNRNMISFSLIAEQQQLQLERAISKIGEKGEKMSSQVANDIGQQQKQLQQQVNPPSFKQADQNEIKSEKQQQPEKAEESSQNTQIEQATCDQ